MSQRKERIIDMERKQKERHLYSDRYALSIYEAAEYFHIGQTKLRSIVDQNAHAPYVLRSGGKVMIKRRLFEEFLDGINEL